MKVIVETDRLFLRQEKNGHIDTDIILLQVENILLTIERQFIKNRYNKNISKFAVHAATQELGGNYVQLEIKNCGTTSKKTSFTAAIS